MGFKSKVDGRRGNVQQTEDYYGDKAEGRWDISPNLVLVCAINQYTTCDLSHVPMGLGTRIGEGGQGDGRVSTSQAE